MNFNVINFKIGDESKQEMLEGLREATAMVEKGEIIDMAIAVVTREPSGDRTFASSFYGKVAKGLLIAAVVDLQFRLHSEDYSNAN